MPARWSCKYCLPTHLRLVLPAACLMQEPDGEVMTTLRWYCLPEETHTGRQVSRHDGSSGLQAG